MSYRIPLFDLNFDSREEEAVIQVLNSRWISSGPKTGQLEKSFAKVLGTSYAVAMTNCTASLHIAMLLCGIGKGDEVICPSLTFVATVNAIRYTGATPVFADIASAEDPTIAADEVERNISSRTKAVVVMHYAGFPCNMSGIMALAKRYKLKVIEDACHGPLSEYQGKKLGTIGDIGCFSFFSNKNISTGEGGMLVTDNQEYDQRCRLLRSHGMTSMSYDRAMGHSTTYDVVEPGYNYRIDDIRASIGLVQLAKLENDLIRRSEARAHYLGCLSDAEGIIIPFTDHKGFVSNYIFPMVLDTTDNKKRDRVREHLAEKGIQTSVHYPAVHRFSIYKGLNAKLPHTEFVADNVITLPMYANLSRQQIEEISYELLKAVSS